MCSDDSARADTAYRNLLPTGRSTLWAAVAAVAVFSGTLGCAPQGQGTEDLTAQEEQALADTVEMQARQIMDAYSETQPDGYFPHFSDDFRYYFRSWYDRGAWKQLVGEHMDAWQITPDEIEVEILGPDAAVATGNYRSLPVDTTGTGPEERAYAFTAVFERRNGQWKVVRLHESLAG